MGHWFDGRLFGAAFVTLVVIMDPPGTVPLFLALMSGRSRQAVRRAAWQAVLVAFAVICSFAVFGQQILAYLHITLPALQGALERGQDIVIAGSAGSGKTHLLESIMGANSATP